MQESPGDPREGRHSLEKRLKGCFLGLLKGAIYLLIYLFINKTYWLSILKESNFGWLTIIKVKNYLSKNIKS